MSAQKSVIGPCWLINSLWFLGYGSLSFATINIPERTFQQIRLVSQEIVQTCPPDTCLVIGIGRSPIPFVAYLEEDYRNYILSIPLSRFSSGTIKRKTKHPELTPEDNKKLDTHFATFLPEALLNAKKSILIIDYTEEGGTLVASFRYLSKYLHHRVAHLNVEMLAIAANQRIIQMDPTVRSVIALSDTDPDDLAYALHFERYKDYSPFGTFYLNSDSPYAKLPEKRPEYIQFATKLHELKAHHKAPASTDLRATVKRIERKQFDPSELHSLSEQDALNLVHTLRFYEVDLVDKIAPIFLADQRLRHLVIRQLEQSPFLGTKTIESLIQTLSTVPDEEKKIILQKLNYYPFAELSFDSFRELSVLLDQEKHAQQVVDIFAKLSIPKLDPVTQEKISLFLEVGPYESNPNWNDYPDSAFYTLLKVPFLSVEVAQRVKTYREKLIKDCPQGVESFTVERIQKIGKITNQEIEWLVKLLTDSLKATRRKSAGFLLRYPYFSAELQGKIQKLIPGINAVNSALSPEKIRDVIALLR